MIRSNIFLEVLFLKCFALHTKRKKCGQMGPIPCYAQSQFMFACQSFRPVAPFFFLEKVSFLAFLNTEKGVAI